MALAGFPMGVINHPLLRWVVGLVIAIAIHMAYNNVAFHQSVFGQTGLLVLVAIAFAALLFVVAFLIPWLRNFYELKSPTLGDISAWAIGTVIGITGMLFSLRLFDSTTQ